MKTTRKRKSSGRKKRLHAVSRYAQDVLDGKIITGRLVRLACERHFRDLEKGPKRGLSFNEDSANHAINFYPEFLRHVEGRFADKPFQLSPHQKFIIGSLYGWLKPNGYRRYRIAYIEEGKGDGKTPLAAGAALYGLVFDGEQGAEIYTAANTRDQAGIAFNDCKNMAEKSLLAPRLAISQHNIAFPDTYSFIRAVSSEARSLDGKRVHMAILDEIHEHASPIVVNKMQAGWKGRMQPLNFEITNALALDTPIPTPSGWAKMSSLLVGDEVLNEEGQPCKVTGVSPIAIGHNCYKVRFDDGSEIIADAQHLWETTAQYGFQTSDQYLSCWINQKRSRRGVFISGTKRVKTAIRTTEEIARTVQRFKTQKNHSVRLAKYLKLPTLDLPIAPYVLGVWIGDGSSKEASIVVSNEDLEILNHIAACGVAVGEKRLVGRTGAKVDNLAVYPIGKGTGHGRSSRGSLNAKMRDIGLLNNKHIPEPYLRASFQQRLELLQGLMDTDGHIAKRSGRCQFTQKGERINLVRQVAELVNSLGMKCTVRQSVSVTRGKSFPRLDVFFYPPWDMQVFKLNRKQQYNYPRHRRTRMSQKRQIIAIESVPSVPVRCIAVDSSSHLYLAGRSMIPTHNSGYDRTSVCWAHHEYGRQILEQVAEDDEFFAYICQLDPCRKCRAEGKTQPDDGCPHCDHWWDEKVWIKANPNIRKSITVDYLRTEVRQGRSMPDKMNMVKRLNFCIWTEGRLQWMPMDEWDQCATPSFNYSDLLGRRCFLGLDLADNIDTTSLALLFPPEKELDADAAEILPAHCYFLLGFVFIPEEMSKRSEQQRERFRSWISQGYMNATPGNLIDERYVLNVVSKCRADFDVRALALDTQHGAGKIQTDLQERCGFSVDLKEATLSGKPPLLAVSHQNKAISAPMREFMNLVLQHRLLHNGNPVLRWMISNVVVETDPEGLVRPKKGASVDKIDLAVAAVYALEKSMRLLKEISIYEQRLKDGGPIVRSF